MARFRIFFCPDCSDRVTLTANGFRCANCVKLIPKAQVKTSLIEPIESSIPELQMRMCTASELRFFQLFQFLTLRYWKKGLRAMRSVWASFLSSIKTEILHCPRCVSEVTFKALNYYCSSCKKYFERIQLIRVTLWEFKPFQYTPFYKRNGQPVEPNRTLAYEYGRLLQLLTKAGITKGIPVLKIWDAVRSELESLDKLDAVGGLEWVMGKSKIGFTKKDITEWVYNENKMVKTPERHKGNDLIHDPDGIDTVDVIKDPVPLYPIRTPVTHFCALLLYILTYQRGKRRREK